MLKTHDQDYLADELQTAFEKLTNQARFVQMIVDKQLVVSNRKKADIVVDLRKHKFRPFPKVKSAKAAGETEPAAEDEDADDAEPDVNGVSLADYDYLLGMPIWSLTKEKIAKLGEQAGEKEKELLVLLEKTPVDLWDVDLDVFLKGWEVCGLQFLLLLFLIYFIQNDCLEFEEKAVKDAKGKKVKKKQAVLRTRKSIGQGRGSDDDDDDFKPVKAPAAAKRKPAATTETRKASSSKGKEKAKEEEDGEMLPPVKEAAVPKRKAGVQKKTYVVVDDDDEEDDEYGEVTAAAKKKTTQTRDATKKDVVMKEAPAAKKTAAAPKRVKVPDEDASSEEYVELQKAKGKQPKKMQVLDEEEASSEDYNEPPKAKGKQAKKAQVVESDSDSELEIIERPNKDTKGKRKR